MSPSLSLSLYLYLSLPILSPSIIISLLHYLLPVGIVVLFYVWCYSDCLFFWECCVFSVLGALALSCPGSSPPHPQTSLFNPQHFLPRHWPSVYAYLYTWTACQGQMGRQRSEWIHIHAHAVTHTHTHTDMQEWDLSSSPIFSSLRGRRIYWKCPVLQPTAEYCLYNIQYG